MMTQALKVPWEFEDSLRFLSIHSPSMLLIIPPKGEGGILFYLCPSKIFFVAFFSVTVDGRNLIFGHKLHIGIPYCGQRFWTRQIPTSCLPTQLVFCICFSCSILFILNSFFFFFHMSIPDKRVNVANSFQLNTYTEDFPCRFWFIFAHHSEMQINGKFLTLEHLYLYNNTLKYNSCC